LRRKIIASIILYFMIEFQDSTGRLIVAMSMRIRHAGKLAIVFVDGRRIADFPTMGEAAIYARSLAQGRYVEMTGQPDDG
jgi:hypothetical protein